MFAIDLKEDIHSVSEFRSNINTYIAQIKKTHRPLVLTQNGKSSAVLLDVNDYQKMIDRMELMDDIMLSQAQIRRGQCSSHEEVSARMREKFCK